MSPEEKRAYQRGYQAGKRRKQREISFEARDRERKAFAERAFLAALPACITAHGCRTAQGTPITSLPNRVELAADFAREALKHRDLL